MASDRDPELVHDFVTEAAEGLDALDSDLVALEDQPDDAQIIQRIFRTIHSIKGNSSFLDFPKLEEVAHAAETLLTEVSESRLSVTRPVATTLLQVVDALREMLGQIEVDQTEGDADYEPLLEQLRRVQKPASAGPATAPRPNRIGELLISKGLVERADIDLAITLQNQGDPRRLGEILVEQGKVGSEQLVEVLHELERERSMVEKPKTIRIETQVLDKLLHLGEEMVPALMQLLACEAALRGSAQRVSDLMQQVKDEVARARMQRIEALWDKFPRVVRDLAVSCGKEVRLVLEGADTLVDKLILEAMRDPMTHIVRNAVDHGIERPDVRVASGKPVEGCLKLHARREEGALIVEVSDDGAGINTARVRAKAIERGLITPERAAELDEREIIELIFTPGFSTAERVSHISGRGIGMDAVRFNIKQAGGNVEVESRMGEGSTLRITFPS